MSYLQFDYVSFSVFILETDPKITNVWVMALQRYAVFDWIANGLFINQ